MRYSIYVLLGLIYTLMGAIVCYVVATMRRESKRPPQPQTPQK